MKYILFVITILLSNLLLFSEDHALTGDDLLKMIDKNMNADSMTGESRMIIHTRRDTREITTRFWIQGTEKSFSEYLSPPREKGTKMLKLNDDLWTYTPAANRKIRISGHMLRQSVSGSDLSYEDYMEDSSLQKSYTAEITGEEVIQNSKCYIVQLTARTEDVAYSSRKIWVDKEKFIPLQENRYAKSGKLLKKTEIREVMKVGSRWYPKVMYFKDVLKNGKGTEYIIDKIEFDVKINPAIFSRASLKK